ncbi:glycosyltransferase family 61 protein [Nocardioides sp. R1-1]|uniref:glycosyltransferase family 61 protein n=1 Tax=Nocardioides sp. R1-1 TaxID=3383502 RepID=UPI0038CF923B
MRRRPFLRSRPARVAARAARLVTGTAPRVVVLGPHRTAVEQALLEHLPAAELVALPPDPDRHHLVLATSEPVDLVVDTGAQDRLRTFRTCFFHLRPGGSQVIADGAGELGPRPGPLGRLLCDAADAADAPGPAAGPLRTFKVPPRPSELRALREHVRARAEAGDLVLTHDLPDVHALIREEDLDGILPLLPGGHRVLAVVEAAAPPLPRAEEGPVPRSRHAGRGLAAVPLRLREYRDVVVAPHQVVLAGRVVLPDSFRHHQSPLLWNKALAGVSPGHAVPVYPPPADLPRLEGTLVHLDDESRGHFGHLLTETLSRVWAWPEALARDPDARVVVCATPQRPALMAYEREIYAACGIPGDRVVLAEGATRVERLLSGTPMLSNPHYVHPRIAETWDLVGDRLAAQAQPRAWPRRIFVGRRERKRRCHNAAEVEAQFRAHGFEVVHPEDHSLGDQVRMFRAAEVVAGFGGSGLFQLAFVAEPTRVVEVVSDAYHARNELLIAAVRGHRIDTIVCRADRRAFQSPFRYDDAREGPLLRTVLASL